MLRLNLIVLAMVNVTTLYFSSSLDWRADDGNVIYVRNNNYIESLCSFDEFIAPASAVLPESWTS